MISSCNEPIRIVKLLLILASLSYYVYSSSIEVGGHITSDAVWDVDTVKVIDTLTIDSGITVTVNPGTRVEFQGHYGIYVFGTFLAIGSENNRIRLTIFDTTGFGNIEVTDGGWNSIRFYSISDSSDSSILSYCIIEYSKRTGDKYRGAYGGAIYVQLCSKIRISNCIISNNYARSLGGGIYCGIASPNISYCEITNNRANLQGGGIACMDKANPLISHCVISNNFGRSGGGGIYLQRFPKPTIINTSILSNVTEGKGGGIYCNLEHCGAKIVNCLIKYNSAEWGGGLSVHNCEDVGPVLINTIISNNLATQKGSAIDFTDSRIDINNCTIVNNIALLDGSVLYGTNIVPYIYLTNTILWGNKQEQLDQITNFIWNYCCVEGGSNPSNGNIHVYPEFKDTANGDWSLKRNSPCIDTGKVDTTGLNLPPDDYLNNPRIVNDRIDMGAIEYQGPTDIISNKKAIESLYSNNISINNIPSSCKEISIYNLRGALIAHYKTPEEFQPLFKLLSNNIYLIKFGSSDNRLILKYSIIK